MDKIEDTHLITEADFSINELLLQFFYYYILILKTSNLVLKLFRNRLLSVRWVIRLAPLKSFFPSHYRLWLLIRDPNLQLIFCKIALWRRLWLKAPYKKGELNVSLLTICFLLHWSFILILLFFIIIILAVYSAVKEKLTADPDSEIATTSLRVSLLCPVSAHTHMHKHCVTPPPNKYFYKSRLAAL